MVFDNLSLWSVEEIKTINKQLNEIEIEAKTPFFGECIKVKFGKKVLHFYTKQGEKTKKITFQKGVHCGSQGLEISSHFYKTYKKPIKCELGHIHGHEVKTELGTWEYVRLDWEHVESLIEWLQYGNWSQVKNQDWKIK